MRGLVALRSDRLAGIDEHIAPCSGASETGCARSPWRWPPTWRRSPPRTAMTSPRSTGSRRGRRPTTNAAGTRSAWLTGCAFTGLAHRLLLDIPAAENCFRKALKIAKRSGGSHSYSARLASSMLGELLYERGELDEAERLLDEGYKLGPEGGSVDFKIARYVIGARIKALRAIGRQRSKGSTRPPGSRARCR